MEALSKARKSSKHKKSKTKSKTTKSKTTKSTNKSTTKPSKSSKSSSRTRTSRKSSFEELTDCHKALLKIALRKGLYPEIKTDFESANFPKVLEFVHKHVSRKADKAISRIYQAIEKKTRGNAKLTRTASRGSRIMDGGAEVAESSA